MSVAPLIILSGPSGSGKSTLIARLLEEQRWLRSRVHMPIFADEACLRSRDIPKVADAYDGIVVKVDKAGGLLEAVRSIHTARSFGLKVMLGCMVSSSVAITAAAHVSPLADYADLDGNLVVNSTDFSILRGSFGVGGAPPIHP